MKLILSEFYKVNIKLNFALEFKIHLYERTGTNKKSNTCGIDKEIG